MWFVEIPSFSKARCKGQFHAIADAFASLERKGILVTEMRLNSIDLEMLKADEDFVGQSQILEDGRIAVWTAILVEDDSMECVRLSGVS
jgi:hypothetical protein